MGSFSNNALSNPSDKSLDYYDLHSNFSKHPIAPKTGSPAHTRTCLAQSLDFKLQANTDYSAGLPFSRCPMRLTNNWVTERSSQYLIHLVKFTNIQPHNDNI